MHCLQSVPRSPAGFAQFAQRWGTRYAARGKVIWTEQSLHDDGAAPTADRRPRRPEVDLDPPVPLPLALATT